MTIICLSQAGQDTFPRYLLGRPGTYLEIGSYHPTFHNNTHSLEKEGWTGLSIDWTDYSAEFKKRRTNPFLWGDATTIDWAETVSKYPFMERPIDYISFDVDEATLAAFNLFPWSTIRFATMTIEHDQYRFGTRIRDHLRRVLTSQGYTLICSDVVVPGFGAFEDWWADLNLVDSTKANTIRCDNTSYLDILKKMDPSPDAFYCPTPTFD